MVVYIGYNKRSCVTGKALFDYLKLNAEGRFSVRRCMRSNPNQPHDVFIRWGTCKLLSDADHQINMIASVVYASHKEEMMNQFINDGEVPIPPVVTFEEDDGTNLYDYAEDVLNDWEVGNAFFRNAHDQIRYRNHYVEGDKYVLKPIEKEKEYRVHVFEGKTIGVYEKIPLEGMDGTIRKDENCRFRRVVVSDEEQRQEIKGVRPAARAAIQSLSLDFGGVDVIKSTDGEIFVLEVNSAPALNEPNVKRWGDLFIKKILSYAGDDNQD